MASNKVFFSRMVISALELLCILPLLIGLSKVSPVIAVVQAAWSGDASTSEVCWKILPVTGPLFLAMFLFGVLRAVKGTIKSSTHDPSQPWLANPMWAAKHIRLNNRGHFLIVVSLLLFYVGILVPFSLASEKTPFFVFCGVLGVVFLLIARVFWLNRKWNTAELRMADVPGVIGGPFSGVVILKQSFPAGTAFEICLKCEESQTVRTKGTDSDGDTTRGSETRTQTIWSSTISIDKQLPADTPNKTLVPFSFAIPFECEPTSEDKNGRLIAWRLVAKEKNKVGFGGSVFTVPVFKTPDSSPDFELDHDLIAPFQVEVDVDAVLARVGLKKEVIAGGGQRLVLEKRELSTAFSMATASLVCLAIVIASFWYIRPFIGAVFAAMFPGLVLLAVVYSLLDMLLWRSAIEMNRNELRCESGWQGFRKSLTFVEQERPIFTAQLDRLKENGEWYRVDVCKRSVDTESDEQFEDTIPLVRKLDGRAEAEAIAGWLDQQCQQA